MKEVIRVILSNNHHDSHHDYDKVMHTVSRDRAGCLVIKNIATNKIVKAYSPLAWLEVSSHTKQ